MSAKETANRLVRPVAAAIAGRTVVRMLGIWAAFVTGDGHGGLLEAGVPRANVYRYAEEFRRFMGTEVEHFEFHPDDARALIAYLKTHQSPEARRLFRPPVKSKVNA